MTKFSFLLILFYFLSCSTAVETRINKENWKVSEKTMAGDEALRLIQQKRRFLLLTFEQFMNPLYQGQKWTDACVEQNKIGNIREESGIILWHSVLYTGPEFRTGFCPDHQGAEESSFVMLYCRQSKKLIQVNCLSRDCRNVFWDKQC